MYKDLIAVTNRHLVEGDFLTQIKRVIVLEPSGILLREKDLELATYERLLQEVVSLLRSEAKTVPLFIHSHFELVMKYQHRYANLGLHVPYHLLVERQEELMAMQQCWKSQHGHGLQVSVSCHTLEEVERVETLGGTQIVLGNIFETECKKGVPGKGLDFLEQAVHKTSLPVYGIGGITPENLNALRNRGAAGGCMMSGFMKPMCKCDSVRV